MKYVPENGMTVSLLVIWNDKTVNLDRPFRQAGWCGNLFDRNWLMAFSERE